MRLYLIGVGFDGEVSESHRYFLKSGKGPTDALNKVSEELAGGNFHFDSLMEINYADGREILLRDKGNPEEKLFGAFVGYYLEEDPVEHHNFLFLVDKNIERAKAKAEKVTSMIEGITPHIDSVFEVKEIEGWKIIPEPSPEAESNRIYHHDDIKRLFDKSKKGG